MEKLELSYGANIKIRNFYLYHPKLKDIAEIGEKKYTSYVNLLTTSAKAMADIFWVEQKKWYEEFDDWELFCGICSGNSAYKDAFRFFFKREFIMIRLASGEIGFVGYDGDKYDFDENTSNQEILKTIMGDKDLIKFDHMDFIIVREKIKEMNFMPKSERFERGGNTRTKKYLLKQMYKKRKRNREPDQNIASMSSVISVELGLGEDIWNYSIYRIHQEFRRILKREEFLSLKSAYYHGKIDTKKNKIDLQKMHWSNKIL